MNMEVIKTKTQINDFLSSIKSADSNNFIIINRNIEKPKNPFTFIHKLEYDIIDMINEIKNLTYKDYLRCQIDSKNDFFLMYCFIKVIKQYIVYIKLSIVENVNENIYVISFHEAEKDELNERPYKEEK